MDMPHYHKRVSADSSCSVIWCSARAACAEVSTGSVEGSEAKHGFGLHMEPSMYRKIICICYSDTQH
jgi:hypothetical protein